MKKEFVCKNCHRVFQKEYYPSRDIPIFCSNSCRSNFNRRSVKCPICSKEFTKPKCRTENDYCSRECGFEGRRRKMKICKNCKKEYRPTSPNNKGYCSLKCAMQARKNTRILKICETCGKEFIVKKGYAHARYCSMKCSAIAIGKRHSGENNWNWKGGSSNWRGENWEIQSQKARNRDSNTCQICHKHGAKQGLPIHHIIPFRDFDNDYKKANRLSNLITLCSVCHTKIECGSISLPNTKPIIRPRRSGKFLKYS